MLKSIYLISNEEKSKYENIFKNIINIIGITIEKLNTEIVSKI